MIEGFDKEIDAILRKTRDGEFVFSNNSQTHLDADEISAFAENALPEKAKGLYTAHLADCDRCRRILSNIISFNSEVEEVPAFVAANEVQTAPVFPWYRRLFAFPSLAYSLGALVLVFGGLIGFIALQNIGNTEISQSSNKPFESKGISNAANNSAPAITMTTNSAANMPMNSNSASVSTANSTANVSSNTAAASNSIAEKQDNLSKEQKQPDAPVASESNEVLAQPQATPIIESKDKAEEESVTTRSLPNPARRNERDEDTKTLKKPIPREDNQPASDAVSGTTSSESMRVGGKTFNRRNNVWYDSEYKNQPTTNITRGTNDYKKLDSDLRQTVERLGGTVVIVWKTKAYRIQ